MSKTYQKAIFKYTSRNANARKLEKRLANKVCRDKDLSNGKSYKKSFESWKISDYYFYNMKAIKNFPNKIKNGYKWVILKENKEE